MLYVKAIRPGQFHGRATLKRWRHHRERAAVRGSVAALPHEAASAWQAACDLDIARELVAIRAEE